MIQQKRNAKAYAGLFVKGMAMGAADVVPGVSGGTIAFITGIYDELLHSLQQLNFKALFILKNEGFAAAWSYINGGFLLALFAGILLSLKTFAEIITIALDAYPIVVWAFFFGLILASVIYFARQQSGWGWRHFLACAVGAAFVFAVSLASPAQLPGHWWMLFIGGFIAICAMILPGISGSFLLLLMGLYPVFLRALSDLDIVALASFGAGCICGLLSFSRVLAWLLDNYHKATLAVLIGFLIGSLNVTWPWKQTLLTTIDRHGETIPLTQKNVLPWQFEQLTGYESMLMPAIVAFVVGAMLVLSSEIYASKSRLKV